MVMMIPIVALIYALHHENVALKYEHEQEAESEDFETENEDNDEDEDGFDDSVTDDQ